MTVEIINTASVGTGPIQYHPPRGGNRATLQAIISGTATVELQGSVDGVNFAPITKFSSNGLESLTLPPYTQAEVTSHTSGDVILKMALPT